MYMANKLVKIYNRSPYWNEFKHYEIADKSPVTSKRRNQQKITGLLHGRSSQFTLI